MTEALISTKLFIPATRPERVSRPRLIEKLNNGFHHKLTLVSAPAGFGKTTIVSEWIKLSGQPAAWLSLDEKDNDPTRFLRYLLAALDRADGAKINFPADLIELIQSHQTPPTESILTSVINQIAQSSETILLVLDDYHLIDSPSIHDALDFLQENAPPQLHLIIATREDPLLPLAKLRARDQLTELRAADLRFSYEEAAQFFNQVMRLNLKPEDIASLENRTEGWIAGLQLAAISLQGKSDTAGLIQSFTGSNRHVMDYLLEDVLNQQPKEIQTFLLQQPFVQSLLKPILVDRMLPMLRLTRGIYLQFL